MPVAGELNRALSGTPHYRESDEAQSKASSFIIIEHCSQISQKTKYITTITTAAAATVAAVAAAAATLAAVAATTNLSVAVVSKVPPRLIKRAILSSHNIVILCSIDK